jgi:DNA-binding transcriptional LysR family regulator
VVNLNAMRQFVAVAHELHFGRAAVRLHVAQPALSRAIRQLETEMQVTLLERSRRHVALTPAGAAFLRHALQAIEHADHAKLVAQRVASGEIGKLSVSYTSSALFAALPLALRFFKKRWPSIELVLREESFGDQIVGIRDGRIDLGLLPHKYAKGHGLAVALIRRESLVAAVPRGSALAKLRKVGFDQLAGHPFVHFPEATSPAAHAALLSAFQSIGTPPRIAQEATNAFTILRLVASGLGIGLVAESARMVAMQGVSYVAIDRLPPELKYELAIAWSPSDVPPALANLIDVMKKHASNVV